MLPTFPVRLALPGWLLKSLVICGALGYGMALAAMFGTGRDRLAILMLAPIGLFVVLSLVFARFKQIILALPITTLILPRIELPTGTGTRLPVSLLLALLLTVVWVASLLIRGWRLAPSPLNRPALAFGAVSLLAFAWSIAWRDPGLISAPKFIVTQIAAEATILVSLSAMLLVGNFFDTPGKLKYLVGTFLLFGFLMTLSELAKLDHGLLNDRGLWGGWLVACAYGLLIVQPGLSGWWRIALIAVLGLTFFQIMVVNSLWVSGWAPALVALAVITLLRSWKAFIVFVIVGALVFIASRGFFAQVTQDNVDEGALGRLVIYEQSWRILREHPLLGTGPAGYALYYMTYFPDEARSTHNNYLDIVAQFGFVGLGVWAWLMGVSLFEGWRLSRQAPSGFLRTIVIIATAGWAAALFSMVLGDWVLPFAYNQGIAGYSYTVYSWLFLGTLISVRKLSSAMVAEQSQ